MMGQISEHRTHTRKDCRIPLEVECPARGRAFPREAMLYNVSEEGIYLETEQELRPGEPVHIHLAQEIPRVLECVHLYDCNGTIRWSTQRKVGRHRLYGAGVRFYFSPATGGEVEEGPGIVRRCDMCGEKISLWDARQQGPAWLCRECRKCLERYPGVIYRVTTRYLIGNVL